MVLNICGIIFLILFIAACGISILMEIMKTEYLGNYKILFYLPLGAFSRQVIIFNICASEKLLDPSILFL